MAKDESSRRDPKLSLVLLWGRTEPGTRGPKPGLSVERIVRAAIEVADAEGVDALSMRRVADKLGVGTMSLYRYVPGKGELIDLMLDTVITESEVPLPEAGGWRAWLEWFARDSWRMFHRHPWILLVTQRHPTMGPNETGSFETALRAVDGLGLTPSEMMGTISLVDSFVRGLARNTVDAMEAERRTGVTSMEWWTAQGETLMEVMGDSSYPLMMSLGEAGVWEESDDVAFEFGLARVLDGIQILVEQRRPEGPPS